MAGQRSQTVTRMLRAFLALCLAFGAPAWAHKASDAYATLDNGTSDGLTIKLSLAIKDLDAAIDTLDADNDRQVRWGEIRQAMPRVIAWVDAGLTLRCDGAALKTAWAFDSLETRSDGAYVRLAARLDCAAPRALVLDYRLMKALDPTHRLLLAGTLDGQPVVAVMAPQATAPLSLRGGGGPAGNALPATGPATLAHFFPEGVHHIATGYDHLAFLLALLLPIVLRQRPVTVDADGVRRPGLVALLTTVTGFTIGHSVTLVLATLGWIASPGWVEPAIAITIAISALLNLFPVRWIRADVLALGFGLIHGLGFSNIMSEAGVSGPLLPWALAGFNLGVEAGQLVGVALWCCVHLVLARWRLYEHVVVKGGSCALLALALYWAATRLIA